MVTYVSSIKGQSSITITQFSSLNVDLTVFHNLVAVVIATDHTHSLGRVYFLHDLSSLLQELKGQMCHMTQS